MSTQHHVTYWTAPSGLGHAYPRCGYGRQEPMTRVIVTVAGLCSLEAGQVCQCLRHRWAAYRHDLGIGQERVS